MLSLASCDYFAYDVLHTRDDPDGGLALVEECPEPLAECDGIASTVCETHLDADPANCGFCGRSCEGGSCNSGICAPVLLAAEPEAAPSGLLASGDVLLWATKGGETLRVYDPKSNSASTLLSLGTASPAPTAAVKLDVDSTHIYWVNPQEGILRRTPRTNPAAETLVATGVIDVALAGDDVFWLTSDGRILHRAKNGGGAETEIVSGRSGAADLVGGANAVYWRDSEGIGRWRLQEKDIQRTALVANVGDVTSLGITPFNNTECYYFGTSRYNGTVLGLTGHSTESFNMLSGDQFGAAAPYSRNAVGTLSTRAEIGIRRSEVYWVSSAAAADRVGNVWAITGNLQQSQLPNLRASELAVSGKYLYLSNIDSGFMSRMVR